MVDARMVTASTQGLALSRQPPAVAVARIAASSQGRAFGLGMAGLENSAHSRASGNPVLSPLRLWVPLSRGRAAVTLGSRRNRLSDRNRAPRHLGMHALDHAAVDLHHALVLVL